MAVGSVVVAVGSVSRHISCKLLMRPPVIRFVWTALISVVAHSDGKKDDKSRRASSVSNRIGVGGSVAAMFVGGIGRFPIRESERFLSFRQVIMFDLLIQ